MYRHNLTIHGIASILTYQPTRQKHILYHTTNDSQEHTTKQKDKKEEEELHSLVQDKQRRKLPATIMYASNYWHDLAETKQKPRNRPENRFNKFRCLLTGK
uniref:Uncharacterized protein n=1 Tax=Rhizophora mucronata TaxID=61149 RepID=A0A2P2QW06_RHIMU